MELQCKVQHYDWGKLGVGSLVAKLLHSADPTITIESTKPYAELWIGTHPNGPAFIPARNVLLSDYLKENHDAIGPSVRKKFGVDVPFLLKVLSIRKALSIQAHPTKEHAEELHKNFPEMYKDPNHKPELAIAMTTFEALCGFRPLEEIKQFIAKMPELAQILSQESVYAIIAYEDKGENDSEKILRPMFHSLMLNDKTIIENSLERLMARLKKMDSGAQSALQYPLLKRLYTDFPGDIGCWAMYFLNYITLQQGQAIYLKPNLPHAYLSGDCIECMANSDNVVRAGLTPKHIDVPTLIEMLDYTSYTKDQLLFNPQFEDSNSCIWRPPVPDFAVLKMKVTSEEPYNTSIRPSPSLILITAGQGEACDTEPIRVRPGVVIFLKASRQLTLTADAGRYIEAYQAICNV